MNKFILPSVMAFVLSACTSGDTETVMVDGQEGIVIRPVAMIGTREPTPENVAEAAQRIRTGNHGGGLKKVGARYCPTGFNILREGEPLPRIYVFQPYVQYRVSQEFIISCTT